MAKRGVSLLGAFGAALALCFGGAARAEHLLPSLDADLARVSVSGLSSGAYMAGQFHIAFSGSLIGAALVAGGPYDCAEGALAIALNRCMQTDLGVPDPRRLLDRARDRATRGEIDPLVELSEDRVYVFSGTNDATVTPPVVAAAAAFYRLAGMPDAQIAVVEDLPAGHGFVTETLGNPCPVTDPPFLNACGYDQAGALLAHLHGPLQPPAPPAAELVAFDQSEFLTDPLRHGLALTGHAYVPEACRGEARCGVHVAFHGCRQNEAAVGDAFFGHAGYNRWAETNQLIVLYPQTSATPLNPNACWDWWGYDDAAYATRAGRQMAAVRAMLDRLAGVIRPPAPYCARIEATNLGHWHAGRARLCDWWFVCANGSGERLGFPFGGSTLFEHPEGSFSTVACSP